MSQLTRTLYMFARRYTSVLLSVTAALPICSFAYPNNPCRGSFGQSYGEVYTIAFDVRLSADGKNLDLTNARRGQIASKQLQSRSKDFNVDLKTVWGRAEWVDRYGNMNTLKSTALGPWRGASSSVSYYADLPCSVITDDLSKSLDLAAMQTIGTIPADARAAEIIYEVTDGSAPYGYNSASALYMWSEPYIPRNPIPKPQAASGCKVTGGGNVDVSAGPRSFPLSIQCSSSGSITMRLLNDVGGDSGSTLHSGDNSVHLSDPSGNGFPMNLTVTAVAPYHSSVTVTADKRNAVGEHAYHGVIQVATE